LFTQLFDLKLQNINYEILFFLIFLNLISVFSNSFLFISEEDMFSSAHHDLLKDAPAPINKKVPNVQDYAQSQSMKLKADVTEGQPGEIDIQHLPYCHASWQYNQLC